MVDIYQPTLVDNDLLLFFFGKSFNGFVVILRVGMLVECEGVSLRSGNSHRGHFSALSTFNAFTFAVQN